MHDRIGEPAVIRSNGGDDDLHGGKTDIEVFGMRVARFVDFTTLLNSLVGPLRNRHRQLMQEGPRFVGRC
jgi:hypothetical protein